MDNILQRISLVFWGSACYYPIDISMHHSYNPMDISLNPRYRREKIDHQFGIFLQIFRKARCRCGFCSSEHKTSIEAAPLLAMTISRCRRGEARGKRNTSSRFSKTRRPNPPSQPRTKHRLLATTKDGRTQEHKHDQETQEHKHDQKILNSR